MEQPTSQFPPQPPQTLPTVQQFSTPKPTTSSSQSLEYLPYTPVAFQRTPALPTLDGLLNDPDLTGNNTLSLFSHEHVYSTTICPSVANPISLLLVDFGLNTQESFLMFTKPVY